MKNVQHLLFTAAITAAFIGITLSSHAQCKPAIKIDDHITVIDGTDRFGTSLPIWLTSGQTLAVGSSVTSISVIEFIENGNALEYSKVLNISNLVGTVPSAKVWKVESVIKDNNSSTYRSATFGAGTFTWTVPACAEQICIEAWGAGGGGGGAGYNNDWYAGGGGGGGGFGSECFTVIPNDTYTITVGAGGTGGNYGYPTGTSGTAGGTSSVGSLISATGGNGGIGSSGSTNGAGGTGGISTAASNAQGATGSNGGIGNINYGGAGGAGGNGGSGGATATGSPTSNPGASPGGGGSGGYSSNSTAKGGDGKVIITW